MQCFLVTEQPVELTDKFPTGIRGKFGTMSMYYESSEDSPGYNHNLSEELRATLNDFQDDTWMDIRIIFVLREPQSMCRGILQLHEERPYLKRVIKLPGIESATVIVKIRLPEQVIRGMSLPTGLITSKEMFVMDDSEKICEDPCIQFSDNNWYQVFHERNFSISAHITVEVKINLKKPEQVVSSQQLNWKKMLHEEIGSDVAIIATDGKRVKCHKSVLSASSPVFQRMFQTEMVENKMNAVALHDMNESVVRALLEFVYYSGDERANEDCQTAYELWLAGDQYEIIPDLKTAMSDMLLSKPEEWYNVDVAVKLFQMARKVVNGELLKIKAVQVLKRQSWVRHAAVLHQSTAYKEMFEENPEAAMEFVQLSF